jgi:hypothetical protein
VSQQTDILVEYNGTLVVLGAVDADRFISD